MHQELNPKPRFGRVEGFDWFIWVGCVYPAALLFLLYGSWALAYVSLGHPPRAWIDDPKYLSPLVSICRDGFFILALAAMPVLFISFAFFAIGFLARILQKQYSLRGLVIPSLPFILLVLAIVIDPGEVLKWMAD